MFELGLSFFTVRRSGLSVYLYILFNLLRIFASVKSNSTISLASLSLLPERLFKLMPTEL